MWYTCPGEQALENIWGKKDVKSDGGPMGGCKDGRLERELVVEKKQFLDSVSPGTSEI